MHSARNRYLKAAGALRGHVDDGPAEGHCGVALMPFLSVVFVVLLGALSVYGAEMKFHDRSAWRLENEQLRVTVLEGGGHVAEIVLKDSGGGESINPLWVPKWPSIEPWEFSFEEHGDTYGRSSESALLASIMGHNLCFDFWGGPSQTEFVAGLAFHGDASLVRSAKISQDAESLTHHFDLKRSGTALTRTLRMVRGQPVLYVEEKVENKLVIDRPLGWVQHVTFGSPFVDPDASFFDASATKGHVTKGEEEVAAQWPVGSSESREQDHRRFAPEAPSGKMSYFLLDPAREVEFVSGVNTKHRLLLAYVFQRQDFPWVMVWEENRRIQDPPWSGKEMTRGMEFGNTRIPGTMQAYFKRPRIHDTPTFGWLTAKEKRTVRYLAVMSSIPEGFTGVRNIRLEGSEIVVEGIGVKTPLRINYRPELFVPSQP